MATPDVADIRDFGAVGNGVTDDRAAIQSAINTGIPVFVPRGVFMIGTPGLTWTGDNRIILGNGWDSVIKAMSGASTPATMLQARDHPHYTLTDIQLDMNGAATTALDVGWSTAGQSCQNEFRNIKIAGRNAASVVAFLADNNHDSVYDHILINGMGTAGVGFRCDGGAGVIQLSNLCFLDALLELNVQVALLNQYIGTGIRIRAGGGSNNHLHLTGCNVYTSLITSAGIQIPSTSRCESIVIDSCLFSMSGTGHSVVDGKVDEGVLVRASSFELGSGAASAMFGSATYGGRTANRPLTQLIASNLGPVTYNPTTTTVATDLSASIAGSLFTPATKIAQGIFTLTYASTVNTSVATASYFKLTVTNSTAFTIAVPSNTVPGQQITYDILNSSGGAMGAITWSAAAGGFKLAGTFVNPANTKRRTISFRYDGTNWIEIGRAAADI